MKLLQNTKADTSSIEMFGEKNIEAINIKNIKVANIKLIILHSLYECCLFDFKSINPINTLPPSSGKQGIKLNKAVVKLAKQNRLV